jgi:hypothetical protein
MFFIIGAVPVWARNFDDVVLQIPEKIQRAIFSNEGYYALATSASPVLLSLNTSPEFSQNCSTLLQKKPSTILELVIVIPYSAKRPLHLIDIYNTLSATRNLAGRRYFSHSRKKEVPLFKTAFRIASPNKTTILDDPPLQTVLPMREDIYLIVDDANFGDCYYKCSFAASTHGINYTLTNIKPLTFYLFTVTKQENLTIALYIEPLSEGMLVYGVMGVTLEGIAARRINAASAARKRFDVVKSWLVDGITGVY